MYPIGLTQEEAERRLAQVGPNDALTEERRSIVLQLLRRLASPLVAILLFAAAASAAVGDPINASIVLTIVGLSVVVEMVQTHRSQHAAASLKSQVAQTAAVQRDGRYHELPTRGIVPGDLVRLAAGDLVPADADLVEAKDLHVHEAALTGESLPVEKTTDASGPEELRRVLMGSSIVSGTAVVRVTATGPRTKFGEMAKSLARRAPPSEFERGIARFGRFILEVVLFLVLFVFAVAAVLHRDPLQSLLFAVALAVGLTPEFLPMITTVTLTRGAVRMARQKVIVKNLAAIQNFGSIDVLLCDKTGTLTTGEMTLEEHVDPRGATSERPLLLAYLNSYFESGVDNPVDEAVLQKARLDPLDSAVLRHAHPDIAGYAKVDEIPFDFERRRVSVVAARGDEHLLVTKGAPEHVLAVASSWEVDGGVEPLDDEARAACLATFRRLCARGHRAVGVAYARRDAQSAFTKEDEHDLTFAGFVSFVDPPRDDASTVLASLAAAGIRVKVLTGDNELVAAHVCARVGVSSPRVILGSEVDTMSDAALLHEAEVTDVFARVSPMQKMRVLRALKARGHVVGFLGDGINDAAALHAADVGISVSGATDVAREAADVILLEPGLDVLLAGVLEGRRAFGNVMKYLLMGTSSNFGNMFSMAAAAVVLPFLPMLPTQILLNGFLYDLAQITIPSDNVDDSLVHKPRRWDIGIIRRFMFVIGPISSLFDVLTFYVLLKVFRAPEALFHTGWFVESLATQTLVIFVIRTMGSAWRGRPSLPLVITTLLVVAVGFALPFSPAAHWLGFTPFPASFLLFLVPVVLTYLFVVEGVKRRIMGRALA